MKSTEELVLEAGGIQNLEMFSGISQFDASAIDQLAVVMAPESVAEVVIVRAYRRTLTRGGGGSNWNWNDTNGGQNDNGGGGTEETWTPIAETNTYATRSNYYCNLHNTPTIGTRTNFFAAASRVMKFYSALDVLSDSPSGLPGDRPSFVFFRYNSLISEWLRNVINPEIANLVATNQPPYNTMTGRQRDVALVEHEQALLQIYLDTLQTNNPADYNEFVSVANASLWASEYFPSPLTRVLGVTPQARSAIDLASDRAGRNLDFRIKDDRVKIGLAFVEGVVEDRAAGRSEC